MMLYALGVGFGRDPLDLGELPFVYENAGLKVPPTFASVISRGEAPPERQRMPQKSNINFMMVVDGERRITIHKPLPPKCDILADERIIDILDKGEGKGALIYSQREIVDKASGRLLATLAQTTFCRGDGGFGGPKRETPPPHALPARVPDGVVDLVTRPEMALIYRLSGDINALHVDPQFAKAAGFPRPVLHGLATFGVAGHALLKAVCGYDPTRLTAMAGRFSAPVYPGETSRTEFWRDGNVISFRARVVERDVVAIDRGRAEVTG